VSAPPASVGATSSDPREVRLTMYTLTTAADADADKAAAFEQTIGAVRPWFEALCDVLHVPDLQVTAVLADDFAGAVTRAAQASFNPRHARSPFTAERLGGTVSAKTIPLTEDWAMVGVLFDAAFLEPERAESAVLGASFAARITRRRRPAR